MDDIKKLIENRQVQATLKQLTPKLMCIVKHLGQKIMGNEGVGEGLHVTPYDSGIPYLDNEEQQLPTAEDEPYAIGYIYNGLSIGHNLEIRYLTDDRDLRASYNGYTVYREIEGEIEGYVPNETWENVVDRLYKRAKEKEEQAKKDEKIEKKNTLLKDAKKFLDKLRETWGI